MDQTPPEVMSSGGVAPQPVIRWVDFSGPNGRSIA